jgi:5-hydroxyisourate hydrolase
MAVLSSHTLNSVDGTHAGGIRLSLIKIEGTERKVLLKSATDEGGRFKETIDLSESDTSASFEMILQTGDYFAKQLLPQSGMQILKEVVVRFEMPEVDGSYHIPFMLAPNSYSVWLSS